MASDILQSNLLQSSVIVTGSHYSMTSLVGRLLAEAPEFHLLHEPANARPTPSYDSLAPKHWYEFYDESRADSLAQFLLSAMQSDNLSRAITGRMAAIRSVKQALQVARYVQRKVPMKLTSKPAIIKDPFLLFSAPRLQQQANMRVVLTVRHPCAFAESFIRAGHGFDFANFLQPQLLAAIPEEADAIQLMVNSPGSLAEQAALLWRVLYGYAAQYLVGKGLTMVVRQDEIVLETSATTDKLFAFAGASKTARVDRFIAHNFAAQATDFSQSGSYIQRDGLATLNKWHDRMAAEDVALIRLKTEEVSQKLGYTSKSWIAPT